MAFANGALHIERQSKPNLVGGIARGKVDRIVGRAAFVKLPNNAMGYLEKAKGAKPGDELIVQVATYATDDKAWPLSTEIKLQGRRYFYLPQGKGITVSKRLPEKLALQLKEELSIDFVNGLPGGWIIRSGTGDFTETDRTANAIDAKVLIEKAKAINENSGWLIAPPTILERAQLETAAEIQELDNETLSDRMELLLKLNVPIYGGGRLRLGPTPALITIDVDTGSAGNDHNFTQETADEIMRVISMRAIAGQIVIDPVRSGASRLANYLKLLAPSISPPLTVYGQTKMGLIELSRPRYGPSLYEALDD